MFRKPENAVLKSRIEALENENRSAARSVKRLREDLDRSDRRVDKYMTLYIELWNRYVWPVLQYENQVQSRPEIAFDQEAYTDRVRSIWPHLGIYLQECEILIRGDRLQFMFPAERAFHAELTSKDKQARMLKRVASEMYKVDLAIEILVDRKEI